MLTNVVKYRLTTSIKPCSCWLCPDRHYLWVLYIDCNALLQVNSK